MSEKIFCLRPNYFDAFKCDGSKCGAQCCRSDWSIYVDAATYQKYCALPWVVEHLRADSDGRYLIVPDEKNICPLLGEDNLCRVQKAHGEDYLSGVCASYPRIITRFNDFIEVALSPSCPLAAELILSAETLRFEVTEADEKILRLGANNILRGIPDDLAALIFDIQLGMAAILQERRLTLNQRLIILGFFLDRVEDLLDKGELDRRALRGLRAVYASESFMTRQVPLILGNVSFKEQVHENFMRKITVELFGEPLLLREKISAAKFAPLMENLLVNEIVLNAFPWRVDASITKNFGVFVTVHKIFERLIISRGVQSVGEFLSVAGDFSRKIDHSDDFIRQIAAQTEEDLLTLIEKLLRV